MGTDQINAASGQPLSQRVRIPGLIINEPLGALVTKFGWTATWVGCSVAPRLRMLRHGIALAPDGTGRRFDVSGRVPNAPAGCKQGDGDAASHFELDGGAFRSHAPRIGKTAPGL
jgi:hypothetical protein